jgi:anti-sigma factor RsiW
MNGHPDTEQLTAWREGWLSAGERARLEAHLAECDACRRTLRELERLVQQLRSSAGETAPPPGGWEALLEATLAMRDRIEPLTPPATRRWLNPAAAAAAALIIALTAFFLIDRTVTPIDSPTAVAAEVDLPDLLLQEHALASDGVPFSAGVTLLVATERRRW